MPALKADAKRVWDPEMASRPDHRRGAVLPVEEVAERRRAQLSGPIPAGRRRSALVHLTVVSLNRLSVQSERSVTPRG